MGDAFPSTSTAFLSGSLVNGHKLASPSLDVPQVVRQLRDILSEEDRRAMIEELLKECSVESLELVASLIARLRVSHPQVSPGRCADPFSVLPHTVATKILSSLDPVSLCMCLRVCRSWWALASDGRLWKALCTHAHHARMASPAAERTQLNRYTQQDGSVRWKEAFGERFRRWTNWHSGRCTVRTLYGHTDSVICVQLDGDRVVSGGTDGTIRMWDLAEDAAGLKDHTLHGHSDTVRFSIRCPDLHVQEAFK